MEELSPDIISFLKGINYSNNGTKVRGFPGDEWRRISFEDKFKMFKLCSGYFLEGGWDSVSKSKSYYFSINNFLPLIKSLMENHSTEINKSGIYVFEEGVYDHSGGQIEDYASASAQEGIIKGNLTLEKGVLAEYKLDFKPAGTKNEVKDDYHSFIEKEEVEKLILSFL